MGRIRVAATALGVAALLTAGGCATDEPETGSSVEVVAALYPLAEVAERVGGDRAAVTNLTPAGAEPHDLELTPDQVADVEDADVVLVLGQGFQPAVEAAADERDGATVTVLLELPLDAAVEAADPHVWLDPRLMIDIVEVVEGALVAADPDGRATYETNAAAYAADLEQLDREFAEGLAECERTTIVTAHEAFGYLADRYGLVQAPIAGLSPDAEPTPERLAELADLVERDGVTTVFTETLVSPEVAATLASEAGIETAVLDPLEGASDDGHADGADYASAMRANLAALQDALGCALAAATGPPPG